MIKRLLDLLFPYKCPFCGEILKDKSPICEACTEKLPYTKKYKCCSICSRPLAGEFSMPVCNECNRKKRNFVHGFAPVIYSDFSRRAVTRFKYYRHPSYARAFAFLIAEKILAYRGDYSFDFVTFVPQNSRTALIRGYNQSELLARETAKLLHLPCKGTLIRTNDGQRQATLNRAERLKNVRKCYREGKEKLSGNALLIDDVFTTGATVDYCAYLLKKQGCSKVYASCAFVRSDDSYYEKQN